VNVVHALDVVLLLLLLAVLVWRDKLYRHRSIRWSLRLAA
jgi:hypothetical protein